MDAKEIKAALKDAREAISKKDFKAALKSCKIVLQADKDNYNALVFIGVAAQELEQPDKAITAFQRAIAACPTQKLAYQGLCAFYEKSTTEEHKTELLQEYPKLIELHAAGNDKDKQYDLYGKYAQLLIDKGNLEKCAEVLTNQLKICDSPEKEYQVHVAIIKVLSTMPELSLHLTDKLEESLEICLGSYRDSELEILIGWLEKYTKLLFKKEKYRKAFDESWRIHNIYPENIEIMEIVCHSCWELTCRDADDQEFIKMESFLPTLLKENPPSRVAVMMALVLAFQKNDRNKIIEYLNIGMNASSAYECNIYVKCYEILHQLEHVYKIASEGLEFCKTFSEGKEKSVIQASLELSWLKSRLHIVTKEEASADISTLEKLIQQDINIEFLKLLILNYLKIGDCKTAVSTLNNYGHKFNATDKLGFEGVIFHAEGELEIAKFKLLDALNICPDETFFLLELALIYRKLKDFNNSFTNLIKAMKLDPYNPQYIFETGNHFQLLNDVGKAKRCYQKAFNLCPDDHKIGAALSDVYQETNDEESNLNLLKSITSRKDISSVKWAWLRFGLHHLKFKNYKDAVIALQSVLKADPLDSHCWESLADAYMDRGSYIAALKSYSRALELKADSVYCMFQMASIKQLLQEYTEASAEYEVLLSKHPDYIPALKGYGEVFLHRARGNLQQYFHGLAKDCCEKAMQVLAKSVHIRSDLACLWKLLGDVCTLTFDLPDDICILHVPDLTNPAEKDPQVLSKPELLELGGRCYGRAINLMPQCSGLWHDLGNNYFCRSKLGLSSKNDELEKATWCLQKAIRIDVNNASHWNLLGVIVVENKNFMLAQHCFIKSINCDKTNVVAWSNLGLIYLIHDNKELANQAFSVAQSVDPSFLNCWMGQAIIAEAINHHDTIDLFRHSTDLGNHDESILGYANWIILSILKSKNKESEVYTYWVEHMAAIPTACDCMAKFTDRHKTNSQALNMYGLLLEKEKVYRMAMKAYKNSLQILENESSGNEVDYVRNNYARLLCVQGSYKESFSQYIKIKEPDFSSQCGLALAYYKAGLWQESIEAYEAAFHWFTGNDEEKSEILVAMAMVAFKQKDVEKVKTLLFESSQMQSPSVHGILALCALGLLYYEKESVLTMASLQELSPYRHHSQYCSSIAFLLETLFVKQGKIALAKNQLCKTILMQPTNHELWLLLCNHLVSYLKNSKALRTCAMAAEKLSRLSFASKDSGNKDIQGECLIAFCSLLGGNVRLSLKHAQKAVHSNPGSVVGWSSLIMAAFANFEMCFKTVKHLWLLNCIAWIETYSYNNPTLVEKKIVLWMIYYKVYMYMHLGDWETAAASLNQIPPAERCQQYKMLSLLLNRCHSPQQNFKVSLDSFRKEISLTSKNSFGWQILVKSYLAMGEMSEAEAVVLSWIDIASNEKEKLMLAKALVWEAKMMVEEQNKLDLSKIRRSLRAIEALTQTRKVSQFLLALIDCRENNTR